MIHPHNLLTFICQEEQQVFEARGVPGQSEGEWERKLVREDSAQVPGRQLSTPQEGQVSQGWLPSSPRADDDL